MHWLAWNKCTTPKSHGGVGFRDLKVFNQALLACQAWSLIQFLDSLCARLLKAKYYPNVNLLGTAVIESTSASWQGIMHGLELLKCGAIWRTGSGTQVRIWRDNWIPRNDSLKISARRTDERLRWVEELIQPGSRTWNEQKVEQGCTYG
jgi:hypothetical protein